MSGNTATTPADTTSDPDAGAAADEAAEVVDLEATPEDPAERETVVVDHGTPRTSSVIAVVATAIGVALTAPFNVLAAPFGLAGVVIVAGALFLRDSRGYLSLGVGFGILGALLAGAYGAVPPALMLVAVSALLVAWDVGQHGVSIGQQLGRDTRTERLELVHAGITTLVIAVIDVGAFAVFQLAGGGRPASAAALVVIGAVVLLWTLRS